VLLSMMSGNRSVLVFAVGMIFALAGDRAAALDFAPIGDKQIRFSVLAGPEELMGARFGDFRHLLDSRDCYSADRLLFNAFSARYADPPPAGGEVGFSHIRWEFDVVPYKYFGIVLCFALNELEHWEKEIARRKMRGGRKRPVGSKRQPPNRPKLLVNRDMAAFRIIHAASFDYTPALLVLARYVKQGELFESNDEIEYYLLKRACFKSAGCEKLEARLAKLRRKLIRGRQEYIEYVAFKLNAVFAILEFNDPL